MSPIPLAPWLRLCMPRLLPLLLLLITVGCGGSEPPTAVPTATPTAVVVARSRIATAKAPVATPAVPSPTQVPERIPQTGPVTLATFVLPFSPEWHHVLLSPAERTAEFAPLFAALHENHSTTAVGTVADGDGAWVGFNGATEAWLIGWPQDAPEGVGLIAYVLPRKGTTMPGYLRLLQEELAAHDELVVQQATIDYTLHPDVPVGLLHYTLPPQPSAKETGQLTSINGYQLVYFDQTATNMLLVTYIDRRPLSLTAQSAADHTLPPQLEALARLIGTVPNTQENAGYALRRFTD